MQQFDIVCDFANNRRNGENVECLRSPRMSHSFCHYVISPENILGLLARRREANHTHTHTHTHAHSQTRTGRHITRLLGNVVCDAGDKSHHCS